MNALKKLNINQQIALLGMAGVFIIDMLVPLGIAIGVLYMLCFVIISKEPSLVIKKFSAIMIGLIIVKYILFFEPSVHLNYATINRIISILVIVCSTYISINHRKLIETSAEAINRKHEEYVKLEKLYYNQLETMIEGVQMIDFDWKYIFVNPAVVKQSKKTADELLGKTMMECYPGIENTPLFEKLNNCMQNRCIEHFENAFTFPDGKSEYFELLIQPVPSGLFMLSLDINERKQAEMNREEQIKMLEKMLFMISHKIRQPVANIIGISNSLKNTNPDFNDLKTLSTFMCESAVKLDMLTRELNDLVSESRPKN
ncbi:MAG: PAS domain-containing protein [Bacteroidia bacterium]